MRVFFYGLYMDDALLESLGLHPKPLGTARLDDYQLRIGQRATLVPKDGSSAYGWLYDLPCTEVTALYTRPEVREYAPYRVKTVLLQDNSTHEASCYILPGEDAGSEPNIDYATRLAALVSRLGLPSVYAAEIYAVVEAG